MALELGQFMKIRKLERNEQYDKITESKIDHLNDTNAFPASTRKEPNKDYTRHQSSIPFTYLLSTRCHEQLAKNYDYQTRIFQIKYRYTKDQTLGLFNYHLFKFYWLNRKSEKDAGKTNKVSYL